MIWQPWGLLALLAIPVVLAIHLFRRRYRPVPITGLFLYGAAALTPASGRRRERLRRSTSLLLEILAILAVAFFLCDPHRSASEQGTHVVFVLDSRRSLQALVAPGRSVQDDARAAVHAHLESLGANDRVTLIASGEPPRVLIGPAEQVSAARAVLADWQSDAAWHDLDAAIALGIALASGGATIVVSDRIPPGLPREIALIAVGTARPTAGISAVRWLRDAAGERLAVQVLAQGADAERVLTVRDGEAVVLRQPIALADRTAQAITVPLPANWNGQALTVSLEGADPYADDDQVRLQRPSLRVVGWHLDAGDAVADSPGDVAPSAIRRALAAIPGTVEVDAARAHLRIGSDPDATAGQWSVALRSGAAAPVLGPFLARRGDPLLADLDATGVLWSGGAASDDGEALLLAGSTLLVTAQRDGRDRHLRMWCDLGRSTLANHPAWPTWWANLVAARREALPGLADPNVPCGVAVRLVLPPGHDRVAVIAADGGRSDLRADAEGVVLHPGFAQPGAYTLQLPASATPWLTLDAHGLDARLADLTPAVQELRPGTATSDAQRERQRPPLAHLLPILLAGIAALGAWFAYTEESRA